MNPTPPNRIELLEMSARLDDSLPNATQCVKEVHEEVHDAYSSSTIPNDFLYLLTEMDDALEGAYSHKEKADYLLKVEVTANPEKYGIAYIHYMRAKTEVSCSYRTIGKIRRRLSRLRCLGLL